MIIIEVFLIGAGLSADAFAVSVTNGLTLKDVSRKEALRIAGAFGLFQGLMPLLGFMLGTVFTEFIMRFDHWVALIFLSFIGGKMLIDGRRGDGAEGSSPPNVLSHRQLLIQAVATSIDALVAGVVLISMGIEGFWILPCAALIALTTFCFSFFGVGLGKRFGKLLGGRARIIGGVVLIGIGVKVFIEHTLF